MSNEPDHRANLDPLPLLAMAAAGFLLLSYPWVSPLVQDRFVLGIPLIFLFEFGGWALLILLGALYTRGG